eukprot:COSAG06_NODE_471_length_15318_cov_24.861029_5_plen_91_part_00
MHIAGLIITPIKNGKQSDVTYINIIKHADEFDLPVVARRLFSDHMVSAQPRSGCTTRRSLCSAALGERRRKRPRAHLPLLVCAFWRRFQT